MKENPEVFNKTFGKFAIGVSEVELPQGVKNPTHEQIIYSRFEDFKFLENSVGWWIGENCPSSLKNVQLRKLYFIMEVKKYIEAT